MRSSPCRGSRFSFLLLSNIYYAVIKVLISCKLYYFFIIVITVIVITSAIIKPIHPHNIKIG